MDKTFNAAIKANAWQIDPRTIIVKEGHNPRTIFTGIEELSASIIKDGVLFPLRVYPHPEIAEHWYLKTGERRLRAVMMAIKNGTNIARVPAVISYTNGDIQDSLDEVKTNSGVNLTMLEEGALYRKALNHGFTLLEISKDVCKSKTHIDNCLLLEAAPKEVKEHVASGTIAGSHVAAIRRKTKDHNQVVEKVKTAVAKAKSEGRKKVVKADLEDENKKQLSLAVEINIKTIMEDFKLDQYPESESETFYNFGIACYTLNRK